MKVCADRLDPECFLITLRHVPGRMARFLGARDLVVTYKGNNDRWYIPPTYRPAEPETVKFLSQIAQDRAFAHLRAHRK